MYGNVLESAEEYKTVLESVKLYWIVLDCTVFLGPYCIALDCIGLCSIELDWDWSRIHQLDLNLEMDQIGLEWIEQDMVRTGMVLD